MPTHQYRNQYSIREMNFRQGQIQETVTPNSQSNELPTGGNPIFVEGLLLSCAFFLAASWVFVLLARLDWLKALESREKIVDRYRKLPCSNCKFFKNNPYLKCAVHPTKVLSEEAQDCSDYSPIAKKGSSFH